METETKRVASWSQEWLEQEVQRIANRFTITGFHQQLADEAVPAIRGFVRSSFNPLIYHSVRQAAEDAHLEQAGIQPGAPRSA
ncbi:hypothetical protein [Marinicrinis sediminis]|uniref:Uncharacterized protein n=1 Tax=Marinicrinis sediminis TaxID=1652465 RepID=A0ABW5R7T0_9BACL